MNLQSLKTRFIGSYTFLVVLFIIQVPIIYVIVGGMNQKYVQEDIAGSLRKRAVELPEILNRHILTGDESLEAAFNTKKAEYDRVIKVLRVGSKELPPITNPELLAKLNLVEKRWGEMKNALDENMKNGETMNESRAIVQATTFPLVAKLNSIIDAEVSLKDPKISKYINVSGLQRMRTVKLSYLLERYVTSYEDKTGATNEINKTASDFEDTLAELKTVALGTASRGTKGQDFISAVKWAEEIWKLRKENMYKSMKASDAYRTNGLKLSKVYTPGVVTIADELTKLFIKKAQTSGTNGVEIMALAVLISTVIAVFFMWGASAMILRPILRVKETVEKFAGGDLTGRANVKVMLLGRELNDEITNLGSSVDKMADQMSGVISKITDASTHLASTSEQLNVSSSKIKEGTEQQSGQITQVATAMEEMSATVIEVAKNSQDVSESAIHAQEVASNGGEIVGQAMNAMQEVSESTTTTAERISKLGKGSEEIGAIISVINEIAEQTNLLALNAAIEAARAGEQGRGFAVVADEVRKLAERTTNATKEITGMIDSIQAETIKAVEAMDDGTKKVDNGVNLTHETGEVLSKIVEGVQNVSSMIAHIATATEEQSSTTDEISRSMDSISIVAHSNVSTIEEVSNASEEIVALASDLQGLVSGFKVSGNGEVIKQNAANVVSIEEGLKQRTA